jgi:hypothetical protein
LRLIVWESLSKQKYSCAVKGDFSTSVDITVLWCWLQA